MTTRLTFLLDEGRTPTRLYYRRPQSSERLLDLVKRVKRIVYDGLIDLMGRVQEVDVILKMPVKDHKFTVTFKEALKTVESN
jgi:hypothetical protein